MTMPTLDEVLSNKRTDPSVMPSLDSVIGGGPSIATTSKKQPRWKSIGNNPIINTFKKVDKGLTAFQNAGSNSLTFGLNNKLAKYLGQQDEIDSQKSAAGVAGQLTGDLVGIGKLYKLASGATKALKVGKTLKTLATGAAAGAGYQTLKEGVDMAVPDKVTLSDLTNPNFVANHKTLGDRGIDIAKSAAVFAAGDGLLKGAGSILKLGKKPLRYLIKPTKMAEIDATGIQDHTGFKFNTTDVYRNFKSAYGEDFPIVKEAILDPFDAAKGDFVNLQKEYTDKLKSEVVDKLGITKGSKLSKLTQDFGENTITLDQLKTATPDWKKVVEADKFFKNAYGELLDKVNATREAIYPGNLEKQVPKRANYYRHFQESEGLAGLKNIFDTPSQISPGLEGISEFTLPKSKFQGFMQKRGLGPYKSDAVGGFLNYVPSAAYSTHIDPHIGVFEGLAKDIADKTEFTKNANNFVNYLNKFSQDLAGKTNGMDRYFQENIPGGRTTMGALNWLNNRFKANAVLGNASSTLAQVANIPNGIAYAKGHSVQGAMDTIKNFIKPSPQMAQSTFLKERYSDEMYRQFDTKWIQQPKNFAMWAMQTADRIGTEFTWNSAYRKLEAEGSKNAIKGADDATRGLVAGRGVGEAPLMQKSKLFQLVAPFQLEVANLWRVQKDFVTEKDFNGLITLYLSSYLLNQGMEKVRGSKVTFDPIQAVVEASQEGLSPAQRIGRVGGEVLSNLPLGGAVTNALYPSAGGTALGVKLPPKKEIFGSNDPSRFGGGLPILKAYQDPLHFALPPFGGAQAKKTTAGVMSLINGGDTTGGKLKFPVSKDIGTVTKSLLFGPGATKEGRNYYDSNRRPLSKDQTEQYKNSPSKMPLYEEVMKQRDLDRIRGQIDDINKDEDMSADKKAAKIKLLQDQYQKVWDS